jgi:hypothetical protein
MFLAIWDFVGSCHAAFQPAPSVTKRVTTRLKPHEIRMSDFLEGRGRATAFPSALLYPNRVQMEG